MQEGDIWEHPNGGRFVIGMPNLAGGYEATYYDRYGNVMKYIVSPSEEAYWTAAWYVPKPPLPNGVYEYYVDFDFETAPPPGISCVYDSPKTPIEEEEDYRKKRDAIFARMFS